MPIVDQPDPGWWYLAIVGVLGGGAVLATGALSIYSFASHGMVWRVALAATVATVFLPVALLVHAAFTTEYILTEDHLILHSGVAMHATISLVEIERVESVDVIPRVYGWGGGRGLANRFDGLRVVTRDGTTYYLSPSDRDAFRSAIEGRRESLARGGAQVQPMVTSSDHPASPAPTVALVVGAWGCPCP